MEQNCLNDGESLRDSLPPHYQALFDSLARESDDHTMVMPFEMWREAFLNDADLEMAQSSYAQLSPQAYQSLIDTLDLKQFYSLSIPRSYLYCTEDTALAPLKHPVEHLNCPLNHNLRKILIHKLEKS
ncbi:hypothetical protein [Anabaena sp. UHCC 0399]|uniref:hypothetical protein n=1 Tax=Anabaena sp. UHCC 0399 TaxID=3110238 RepID=UPI002B2028F2|nr:hypothetical protein [Anabaena sp. UHCC 0399]MEA5567483.1 hypothetical protein [Anabaena sp. UHCC 0399]